MDVSRQDAQEALDMVAQTMAQTRKAIAAGHAAGIIMLWGVIWIAGFSATYFAPTEGGRIFGLLSVAGAAVTVWLCRKGPVQTSVRSHGSQQIGWLVFWFWGLLAAYTVVWLTLLAPVRSLQCSAFISTVAMFAYVVMGLWLRSSFMLYLGLAVTALTLLGFCLFPTHFYLWMAAMGGGMLLGTGAYIHTRWR